MKHSPNRSLVPVPPNLLHFSAAGQVVLGETAGVLAVLQKENSSGRMGQKEKRMAMAVQPPFKWRHFEAEMILLCVHWYLRYALSYRDLEEMMLEGIVNLVTKLNNMLE